MKQVALRPNLAPTTMQEAIDFSDRLATSVLVPKAFFGRPSDILVAVQWGYEIGLAPLQSLQNIAVINGKPSIYGDALMAIARNHPLCEDIIETMDGEGDAMAAVCVAKRKGSSPVTARFSIGDAKRAGLWDKQGPWQAYPKRMLQMRARSFALRDAFPDALKGLISSEEANDYPAQDVMKDITPHAPPPPKGDVVGVLDMMFAAEPEPCPVPDAPIFEPETGEVYASAPSSPIVFVLTVPPILPTDEAKQMSFGALSAWLERYLAVMKAAANDEKWTHRERMHNLKVIKEANAEVLAQLPADGAEEVEARYSKAIKSLAVKSKEDVANG